MNITPTLPDGYNGPIKQLTCRMCYQVFYLTWANYKRLGESLSCHECSVIESQTAPSWEPQTSASSDSPFPALWTITQVATALHLGRSKVYQLIWKEGLPVIHLEERYAFLPSLCVRGWSNGNKNLDTSSRLSSFSSSSSRRF